MNHLAEGARCVLFGVRGLQALITENLLILFSLLTTQIQQGHKNFTRKSLTISSKNALKRQEVPINRCCFSHEVNVAPESAQETPE